MNLHLWTLTVRNGILNINDDDKIIGVFNIEQETYYEINPDDLGEKVFLYLIPFKPDEVADKPLALQYPRTMYNYRRLKFYEIQIQADEFPEYSRIKSAISDGSGWFSTISMMDGTIYKYSYLLGTWKKLYSWGSHKIELREVKQENTANYTEFDKFFVSLPRHNGKTQLYVEMLNAYNKYILVDVDATATALINYNNHIKNGGKNKMKTNTIYTNWWGAMLDSCYGLHAKNKYLPEIKNVVIADPYTTIIWSDGTKTQVKCMDGDTFDPEHGFTMAVLKKLMETPDKPNAYSKWVKKYVKQGIEAGEKQKKRKEKKTEKKADSEDK